MQRLLFYSRIAFVCNIFFLLAFTLHLTPWVTNEDLTSWILILGYVMGFILNPILNLIYLILFIGRRKFIPPVPSWLVMANVLFLVIQLFYLLYINK